MPSISPPKSQLLPRCNTSFNYPVAVPSMFGLKVNMIGSAFGDGKFCSFSILTTNPADVLPPRPSLLAACATAPGLERIQGQILPLPLGTLSLWLRPRGVHSDRLKSIHQQHQLEMNMRFFDGLPISICVQDLIDMVCLEALFRHVSKRLNFARLKVPRQTVPKLRCQLGICV